MYAGTLHTARSDSFLCTGGFFNNGILKDSKTLCDAAMSNTKDIFVICPAETKFFVPRGFLNKTMQRKGFEGILRLKIKTSCKVP